MKSVQPTPLLHIVRRYGPVGGMERYVWELTLQLRDMGYAVTVVCQRCHVELPVGIKVIELGEVAIRPRWIASLRFSYRVSQWLKNNPQTDALIHSNERVNVQHVSTIHGPPFATVRDKPWWKRASIRVAAQLFLERRELRNARVIIPNSEIIKQQIAHYYPEYAHKLTMPILPGVNAGGVREARLVPLDGGVIGFVGQEWKRKGLAFAVKIVAELRRTRPNLKFIVIGPPRHEIEPLFADWKSGYELMGWSKQARYTEFDVLLHPASAEPYGMVIAEAMAARVPVVISDLCGAKAQVSTDAGAVLSLASPLSDWLAAVEQQLQRSMPVPQFVHGWDKVAQQHDAIYRTFSKEGLL
ncbi:MAG: glycosyltransferase family 4 protein [Sideroxydans sp.]|nr:glycosyltransferase family 4 protein [Sideroxydans sp.]